MKQITWIIACCCFVAMLACSKKATLVETDPPVLDSSGIVTHTGQFGNGPFGTVSGMVEVVKQDSVMAVRLTNFVTNNGPDLHVYLSREIQPVNFVDLGSLRSTTGEQAYTVTTSVMLSEYRFVLIHCKAYNHLFGSAVLMRVN